MVLLLVDIMGQGLQKRGGGCASARCHYGHDTEPIRDRQDRSRGEEANDTATSSGDIDDIHHDASMGEEYVDWERCCISNSVITAKPPRTSAGARYR